MKLRFWLLDINDAITEKGAEIHLWGLDDTANHILVVDKSFPPYFYLLLEDKADIKEVVREIEVKKSPDAVIEEDLERKYFGKPVKAVKITCRDPNSIAKNTNSLGKINGVKASLEDDIRYSFRYLIDNDVYPCGWHEIDVDKIEEKSDNKIEEIYVAKSHPRAIQKSSTPSLRILAFSIVCYSPKGSPKPDKNPVVMISTATSNGKTMQFVSEGSNDKKVIESFIEGIQTYDPDIIVGYGSNSFEWPFLLQRSKKLGIKLKVDRQGGEPHTSVYGHVSVTGRINIDFFDLSDEIEEVKIKTLENIAEYLGATKKADEMLIDDMDIPRYWEDNSKQSILSEYSLKKASTILRVGQNLLNFSMQLSYLVGLPPDQIGAAAVGFRTESYLIRQAYKIKELIPHRIERPYFPYKGATVLEPKPGLHGKTAVLDFRSMYPNIMIAKNISPDTYLESGEKNPYLGVYVAPEMGYSFRKSPPGFYNKVLSTLIEARDDIRDKLKNTDPKKTEYRVLDSRQRAVKIITNAVYGYAGWIGARWYVREVAEATAAWGRYTIAHAIDLAEKEGLEVIYGDTDSLFVLFDSEKIDRFIEDVQRDLGLEISANEVYERIFFTEAKKRYAGIFTDGRLDIVGLEVARGDWSEAAKRVQEGILEIILKGKIIQKATSFVRQYILDLREGKIPFSDLIIWKTLTRDVSEYVVKVPHAEAAKRLLREGWEVARGDKIGFVIVKGRGKLHERAVPYSIATYSEIDLAFYEEQQIIPAASRILSIFNVPIESLKP
ncbi:MAG: polymerase, archaea type [Thermoproteota archaeon]|nr:polymerase, archaea type [Thermoproteota archaeon]